MDIDRELFSRVARLRLRTPRHAGGPRQGERKSKAVGRGVEFADHRVYEPGDELRLVDWNAYARLGALLVRLFHEDRNLRVRITLDATGSMGVDGKLEHAGNLAAGLALMGLLHRDTVSLGCFGGEAAARVVTGHDAGAFPAMLSILERTRAGKAGDLRGGILAQAGKQRADRAILISDVLMSPEALDPTLKALAASARSAVLVHVLGTGDLDPDFSVPMDAVDAETGERAGLPAGAGAKAAYEAELNRWLGQLRARCGTLRIRYLPAWTTLSARTLLSDAFRRAGLVEGAHGVRA